MLLRAVTSFRLASPKKKPGERRFIAEGEIVDSDDPAVKGREHLFAPLTVEKATANPGELRTVRIPKE